MRRSFVLPLVTLVPSLFSANALVVGCSSFSGSDVPGTGGVDAGDTAPHEAGVVTDAGADMDDGGSPKSDGGGVGSDAALTAPELFDTFLTNQACSGWAPRSSAKVFFVATGHDSMGGACRICSTDGSLAVISHPIQPTPLGTYTLTLWLMQAPSTPPAKADLGINFYQGATTYGHAVTEQAPTSWSPVTDANALMVNPERGEVTLAIDSSETPGGCIDVDEVKLAYAP